MESQITFSEMELDVIYILRYCTPPLRIYKIDEGDLNPFLAVCNKESKVYYIYPPIEDDEVCDDLLTEIYKACCNRTKTYSADIYVEKTEIFF